MYQEEISPSRAWQMSINQSVFAKLHDCMENKIAICL